MAAQWLVVALVGVLPAAGPAETPSPPVAKTQAAERTPRELRQAVHEALRAQATTKGAAQEAAVRKLTALYRELSESTTLTDEERLQLRGTVRSRLLRTGDALAQQIAKDDARRRPAAGEDRPGGRAAAILAQQVNPAGGPRNNAAAPNLAQGGRGAQAAGPGGAWAAAKAQNAQELVDLIQSTIAPSSWDVNGGLGTIRYFEPAQVLVIRQTDGVHEQIGPAVEQLRK